MLRLLLLLLLGLLVLPAAAQRYNAKLGPPPAAFVWQPLPEIKAAMLLPHGWFYKVEADKGSTTFYLTREELGETGEYDMGMAVHVVRKAKAHTRHAAVEYADALMLRAGYGPGRQPLAKASSTEGPFHKWTVRYREALPDADARIVYQLALANAKTDTLYLLTFESPEAEWDEAWKLGEAMIADWVLDARQ